MKKLTQNELRDIDQGKSDKYQKYNAYTESCGRKFGFFIEFFNKKTGTCYRVQRKRYYVCGYDYFEYIDQKLLKTKITMDEYEMYWC